MQQKSGFFPGFLDSDGRPWFRMGRKPKDYEHAIESAFKIALLTHRHLFVPAGYFLDNPHIQRLFLRHKGDDNESRCFRLLMKDLLRISPNQLATTGLDLMSEWKPVLHDWAGLDVSSRPRNTYLNCVSHEAAVTIQASKNTDDFIRKMKMGLFSEWQIDLSEYLSLLDSMQFRVVEREEFQFDRLIRQRLLTNEEHFFEYQGFLEEKINTIAEAAKANQVAISRSFLSSPDLCRQIGVKDEHLLTPMEYQTLAPILAHYHHTAFARAFGLDGFASHINPNLQKAAQETLAGELRRTAYKILAEPGSGRVSWPLSLISFEDIWQLRIKRNDFGEFLEPVFDATRSSNADQYAHSLQRYGRHIASVLSRDFSDANPNELAAGLDGSVFSDGTTTKAVFEIAKFALSFCRDFFPNVGKEFQVRWFFRKLRNNSEE